jgi:predicted negative regulator of RcsB-dependent stress response
MDVNLTDDEKVELLKKWWKENGGSIITGVVLGLALLFGGKAWFAYQERQAETASSLYAVMMGALNNGDAGQVTQKAGILMADYTSTPYASLAGLALAKLKIDEGELVAAHAQLQWVLDNAGSEVLRETARLRLVRVMIAEQDLDGAETLAAQASKVSAYEALYAEIDGDIFTARGDFFNASKSYEKALAAMAGDSPGRKQLQLKYDHALILSPGTEEVS